MMRRALAMGAAVLAAVPLVVSYPISAYAIDDYALDQWINNYWEIVETPEFKTLSSPAVEAFDYLDAVVITCMYSGWKEGHPSDMATIACFNGVYVDKADGKTYNGAIFGRSTAADLPGGFTVFAGGSGSIYVSPRSPATFIRLFSLNTWYVGWSGYYYANGVASTGDRPSLGRAYYTTGSAPVVDLSRPAALLDYDSHKPLISNARRSSWVTGFPTGTPENYDDVVSYVNPIIEDTVNDYPELAPFVPDLSTPSPTYPVQETWAENADWPEGNLLPTIPAASYTVEIPEMMTEGAAFWWRCLGVLFDGLGITATVVGLLALGIVLYFVLR